MVAPGLRERKKARTRATIQHEALRLFRGQGYEATTVEQIADAAEVSRSTFFRYFGSKEDVVLTNDYDSALVENYRAQPAGLSPVRAFRRSIREVLGALDDDERAEMRERTELAFSVPELRAALLDQFVQTVGQVAAFIAERADGDPDDFQFSAWAGAVLGAMIAAESYWVDHPGTDLVALFDEAVVHIQPAFGEPGPGD